MKEKFEIRVYIYVYNIPHFILKIVEMQLNKDKKWEQTLEYEKVSDINAISNFHVLHNSNQSKSMLTNVKGIIFLAKTIIFHTSNFIVTRYTILTIYIYI